MHDVHTLYRGILYWGRSHETDGFSAPLPHTKLVRVVAGRLASKSTNYEGEGCMDRRNSFDAVPVLVPVRASPVPSVKKENRQPKRGMGEEDRVHTCTRSKRKKENRQPKGGMGGRHAAEVVPSGGVPKFF